MFINASHLLQRNPRLNYQGITITDVDRDGCFEIVVAGWGHPNRVLKWDGEKLVDLDYEAIADRVGQTLGIIAGDLNGDGWEELYCLNRDRHADRLLIGQGQQWRNLFDSRTLPATGGRSAVCVDRRGDGYYGFFTANSSGSIHFYELRGDRLEDVAAEIGLTRVAGIRGMVALPLVSKGMDIFAANENGANCLFRHSPDGTYEEIAVEAGLEDVHEQGRGVAVLDADGDGKFDIVYGNWEGSHRLFLQGTRGHFRNVAPREMARPSRVRTVIAADFDNDGLEEIFFNSLGEPNRLFGLRDGAWRQLDIGDAWEPDGLGTGAAVGDFDGDGQLELLLSHGESPGQPLSLYRPQTSDHAWLRVAPLTRYGAPARGAICRLTVAGQHQVRAIDAGSGYLCQMEPVAHFGLGRHRHIDRLQVFWPDGATVTLVSPMINQLVRVPYPGSNKPSARFP
ncbi:MAG: CRTAC1 family protein [Phormidium sp. GEM2.Bin31]|nr:MAG: CRTAC1 family protein [Phormidium sp. GEM2.Bin31]